MATKAEMRDRIEARINEGLRDKWYPVAKSVEICSDRPYGTEAQGEKLVLWRTADGSIRCIEDFCPHRGAPLSFGEVHEGHIGCRYHGIIVDGTGTVQRVPAMPDCPMEGSKVLRAYKVQEVADAVFVFLSQKETDTAPDLPLPQELSNPNWTGFLCSAVWDVNYRYALDNLADPMHGCFLHAESFTLAFGSKQDILDLDRKEAGFKVSRVSQVGENLTGCNSILRKGDVLFPGYSLSACCWAGWPYAYPWLCYADGPSPLQGVFLAYARSVRHGPRKLAFSVSGTAGRTALECAGTGSGDAGRDAR